MQLSQWTVNLSAAVDAAARADPPSPVRLNQGPGTRFSLAFK